MSFNLEQLSHQQAAIDSQQRLLSNIIGVVWRKVVKVDRLIETLKEL